MVLRKIRRMPTLSRAEVDRRQSVYVMSAGARHVKIGIATDPYRRVREVQTGNPQGVRIIKAWPSHLARRVERKAHKMLAKYRTKAEWFEVPVKVAVMVVDAIVQANPRDGYVVPRDTTTILFCGACRHSGVIGFMPAPGARFRCSNCKKNDDVHVLELNNQFVSLNVS